MGVPRGFFLDNFIEGHRMEMHWETDYHREASIQTEYSDNLRPYYDEYYVPKVIKDMSTKKILCTEFVNGVEVDLIASESQELRDKVGTLML